MFQNYLKLSKADSLPMFQDNRINLFRFLGYSFEVIYHSKLVFLRLLIYLCLEFIIKIILKTDF